MRTPDAWLLGVQSETTLSCHCEVRNEMSVSDDVEVLVADVSSTSAFAVVRSSVASPPAAISTRSDHS